jgi:uncharacterized protein YndB with AHSA1/START domain
MSQITVTTQIKSTLAEVWKKWTSPEDIVNWNQASDDWHCPSAENDLKVGGQFTFVMASKDGAMSFPFQGEYTAVDQHKEISYRMADGRMAHVSFEAQGDHVEIIESFDPENVNPEDMQRAGWQAILDGFKAYAERG